MSQGSPEPVSANRQHLQPLPMTDATLEWQTERFLELEAHRHGRVVHVMPEQVVEIAIESIQAGSRYRGGMALPCARVKGYREVRPRRKPTRSRRDGRSTRQQAASTEHTIPGRLSTSGPRRYASPLARLVTPQAQPDRDTRPADRGRRRRPRRRHHVCVLSAGCRHCIEDRLHCFVVGDRED
mgnify:CR=1 FL=1